MLDRTRHIVHQFSRYTADIWYEAMYIVLFIYGFLHVNVKGEKYIGSYYKTYIHMCYHILIQHTYEGMLHICFCVVFLTQHATFGIIPPCHVKFWYKNSKHS